MRSDKQRRRAREDRRQRRRVERALAFSQCPLCWYDLTTGEGRRGCHYYECPYLPEMLEVFCPKCNFNFFTREGDADCGDPPRCRFARAEAPLRVDTMVRWLQRHGRAGAATAGEARAPTEKT
jgi:hypothetical protein